MQGKSVNVGKIAYLGLHSSRLNLLTVASTERRIPDFSKVTLVLVNYQLVLISQLQQGGYMDNLLGYNNIE